MDPERISVLTDGGTWNWFDEYDNLEEVGIGSDDLDDFLDLFSLRSLDSDSDFDSDNDENIMETSDSFYGRDNVTEWKKCEISGNKPLPTTESQNVKPLLNINSPLEAFNKFITKEMIESIVYYTSQYISTIQDATPTTITEINGLLGLLFILRNKVDFTVHDLWHLKTCRFGIIDNTMSNERFLFLLKCLRFDDISVKNDVDKLAPIRKFFDAFTSNCKQMYTQGENLTIDKKRIPFLGKNTSKYLVSKKDIKYLKMFALCDAKNLYTVDMEVHTRRQLEDPQQTPENIVKRLCETIKSSKCNLALTSWFMSYPLVHCLMNDYNLNVIGGMSSRHKEIPRQFLADSERKTYSSLFGFQDNLSLVSYVSEYDRAIIVLSSLHTTKDINPKTRKRAVPESVKAYMRSKQTIERLEEKCSENTVARATTCLPLCLFFTILNIASLNAKVIYKEANPGLHKSEKRFYQIMEGIEKGLVKDHVAEIKALKKIQNIFDSEDDDSWTDMEEEICEPESKLQCYVCEESSINVCDKCNKDVCEAHLSKVCLDCNKQNL